MTPAGPPYGPLSLVAASVLPVVGAPAIHGTAHGLVAVGALVVGLLPAVRDWPSTLLRLSFGLLAAASITVSTWLYGGHDADLAFGAGLRILYLVVPAAVLTPYVDPTRLGDHLGQRLRLPARPVVAATAALERMESLGQQWQQIVRARRARGVGLDGTPLHRIRAGGAAAFALLVSTMRMSGSMALAMDSRGFAAAHRRTWAEPAPWQVRDTLILLAGIAMAAWPWLLLPQTRGLLPVG